MTEQKREVKKFQTIPIDLNTTYKYDYKIYGETKRPKIRRQIAQERDCIAGSFETYLRYL